MKTKTKHLRHRKRTAVAVACHAYPGSYAQTDNSGNFSIVRRGSRWLVNPYKDWSDMQKMFGVLA